MAARLLRDVGRCRGPCRARGHTGLCWLLALGLAVLPLYSEADGPTEYEVKAAFLYNCAKFVRWPATVFAGPEAPLVIGILGEDPFGEVLDETVRNRVVQDRRIVIRRLASIKDAARCHLLFISTSEIERLPGILRTVHQTAVLTVSEIDRFAERGGIIYPYVEDKRIRFEVNLSAANMAGLSISSQLLKLARRVIGQPPVEE
jgi:hypothetical protein